LGPSSSQVPYRGFALDPCTIWNFDPSPYRLALSHGLHWTLETQPRNPRRGGGSPRFLRLSNRHCVLLTLWC